MEHSPFRQLEDRYLDAQLAGNRRAVRLIEEGLGSGTRLAEQAADILPKQSINRELAIGRIRDALAKAAAENPPGQERNRA